MAAWTGKASVSLTTQSVTTGSLGTDYGDAPILNFRADNDNQ